MIHFYSESLMSQAYPTISGVAVNLYDASMGFITDSNEFFHNGMFQIQIGLFNSDGNGLITLQQSADGTMWDNLRNSLDIEIASNNSKTFEDTFFTGRYVRILWSPTTLTTGDIKIIVTKKASN